MATNWQIGDRIQNRWEIHDIKRGGMGIVYVVYDHEWHQVFALKTFQDEVFARSPVIAQRFTQEALVWVNLDVHQNVTRAQLVETLLGKPYLFLEFVTGGDLSHWIGTPRLTEDLPQVLRFAIQFCDGMIHAFSRGIIAHRDIKPQNCLITADNTLKVSDFGLAKIIDDSGVAYTDDTSIVADRLSFGMTRTGVAAGTPTHMAPEQFDDAKHVDVRADIYSFGVMLYQMIEGRLPYMGRSWEEYARLHKTEELPKLSGHWPELTAVVLRCLAKSAVDRFSDFVTMWQDLAAIYEELTGDRAHRPVVGNELDAIEWANKGASLGNLGKREEAIECCDRALELSPHDEHACRNKGVLLYGMGQIEEAVTCFDRAIELNPRSENAWSSKGAALGRIGQMEEAVICFDRAIDLNPRHDDAWSNKGNALTMLGRIEEAVVCCDQAIKLNPHHQKAWINKGAALERLERREEAVACYERAIYLDPGDEEVWNSQGSLLRSMGRREEALGCYDQAIALSRSCEKAWANKGLALFELGETGEAVACYDEAIKLNPQFEVPWANKGNALNALGRYEEAIAYYDRAIELNPALEGAWANKGTALYRMGRLEEAVACYDRAIDLNPRHEKVWTNKGTVLCRTGLIEQAVGCFDRAIEVNQRDDDAWYNRGVALNTLGRYEDAVSSFDGAILLNATSAQAWFNKGAALLRGSHLRHREAFACLEEAQRLGSSDAVLVIAQWRRLVEQQ